MSQPLYAIGRDSAGLSRVSGRERLEAAVWTDPNPADAGIRIGETLNVGVPEVAALTANLRRDLRSDTYAIPWWGHTDQGLKVLVADHLVHGAGDLARLLLEARIHLMDLIDIWARQEAAWRGRLAVNALSLPFPETTSLEQDLDELCGPMHLSGIFSALAQAMDCLAVVVIGAMDLPLDIHRASWSQIDDSLRTVSAAGAPRGLVADELLGVRPNAGPDGWLTWLLESRHMRLHRPRLADVIQPTQLGGSLDVPGHDALERVRLTHHLPSAPKASFVECFLAEGGPQQAYLTEDAQLTLERVLRSVQDMVAATANTLDVWWSKRRADDTLHDQRNVTKQWRRRPGPADRFSGYAPGSAPFRATAAVLNTADGERLSAATIGTERPEGLGKPTAP